MRRAVSTTVTLLALACPAPVASQMDDDPWVFAGVSFPPQVDTFVVRAVNRWPGSPDLGVMLQYVTAWEQSARFDVYVYPITGPGAAASGSTALSAEFQRSMESVVQYNEREDDVTLEVEEEGPWPALSGPGRHARYTLRRGSQARESRLLVFTRDGYFFKFRMTYERAVRRLLPDHVEAFVGEALERISVGKG